MGMRAGFSMDNHGNLRDTLGTYSSANDVSSRSVMHVSNSIIIIHCRHYIDNIWTVMSVGSSNTVKRRPRRLLPTGNDLELA